MSVLKNMHKISLWIGLGIIAIACDTGWGCGGRQQTKYPSSIKNMAYRMIEYYIAVKRIK